MMCASTISPVGLSTKIDTRCGGVAPFDAATHASTIWRATSDEI